MLHYQTINSEALELLNSMMNEPVLSGLRLVGGTGLALQLGHRQSIDIDLFGSIEFNNLNTDRIFKKHNSVNLIKKSENINIYAINGIKVDFVNYTFPWLNDEIIEDKIRIASVPDIAAMKLAAIAGRGSKKDFVDLYWLLKQYSLKKLIEFYENKYSDGSTFLVIKSLTYFEDAESDEMPVLTKPVSWEEIKRTIRTAVKSS